MITVLTKEYGAPPITEREVLRYAGVPAPTPRDTELLTSCVEEAREELKYRVCYAELPVRIEGDISYLGELALRSSALARCLAGCSRAVVLAATVGVGIDRLIARYSRINAPRALMLQALGSERIEALCNTFCRELESNSEGGLRPRFSPGYGDLSLSAQQDLFALLQCEKRIGLTLNHSLLMSPTKSVTAIVGLQRKN